VLVRVGYDLASVEVMAAAVLATAFEGGG